MEDRLAEIRAKVESATGENQHLYKHFNAYKEDVSYLLELVDDVLPSLVAKNLEIDHLQQRVKELEEQLENQFCELSWEFY